MKQKSLHILGDFYNCRAEKKYFSNINVVRKSITRLVKKSGFTIVASRFHKFGKDPYGEEGGITAVIIVSESHLTIHTWPERKFLNVDVFFCSYTTDNSKKVRECFRELAELYKPKRVRKKDVHRD